MGVVRIGGPGGGRRRAAGSLAGKAVRWALAPALAVAIVSGLEGALAEEPAPPPLRPGFVERTGVSLILLDVEVRDREGRPMRGLKREDFLVRLNAREAEIASVDDLCACPDAAPPADAAPVAVAEGGGGSTAEESAGGASAGAGVEAVAPLPAPESPVYVLFLEFSQLRPDGRGIAVAQAKRWVRETMQAGDRALVVAHSSQTGLREMSPLTGDREALIRAIEEADADPRMLDAFPARFAERIRECAACCYRSGRGGVRTDVPCPGCGIECIGNSMDEYAQGRRALSALRHLISSLEEIPGRKALIYFHQNGVIFPARYYPLVQTDFTLGDHVRAIEEVGAEATATRTAIYTVTSGSDTGPGGGAVNLGANLAEYTGGGYNRGTTDLESLLDRAGRDCACLYRIGIVPPETDRSRIYRATVDVRDRTLPAHFRVQYLRPTDQWMRRALAVLARPGQARDVVIGAALVPGARSGRTWTAVVEIAVDIDSLTLVSSPGGGQGSWEVGALLVHEASGRAWDMLAVSQATAPARAPSGRVVLHERDLEKLPAGTYRLAAFVRDRTADLFGAAETFVELPAEETDALAGPVLRLAARPHVRSALPLLKERDEAGRARGEPASGPVPAFSRATAAGRTIEMLTWVCPEEGRGRETAGDGPENDGAGRALRYVSRDGEPLFRIADSPPLPAGSCLRFRDLLETESLQAGAYVYHFLWQRSGGRPPLKAEAPFEIIRSPVSPP